MERLCFAETAHDGVGERAGCRHHGPRDGALHQRQAARSALARPGEERPTREYTLKSYTVCEIIPKKEIPLRNSLTLFNQDLHETK